MEIGRKRRCEARQSAREKKQPYGGPAGRRHFNDIVACRHIGGAVVNRQDAGFVGNFPNGPFSPPALTALKINTFSARQMVFGGVTQQIGFATHLSANVWRTIQTGKTQPGDGNATQFQLLADYNWSKRTDTYLEVDYSQYRGGLVGAQLQGVNGISSAFGTTQLGVSAGLRHLF